MPKITREQYTEKLHNAIKVGDFKEFMAIYSNADIIAEDNRAIRLAAFHGRTLMFDRLFDDKQTNPGANDNEASLAAAFGGHHNISKQLAIGGFVHPDAEIWARRNGHIAVADEIAKWSSGPTSPTSTLATRTNSKLTPHVRVYPRNARHVVKPNI